LGFSEHPVIHAVYHRLTGRVGLVVMACQIFKGSEGITGRNVGKYIGEEVSQKLIRQATNAFISYLLVFQHHPI
jgi:hypothetical protein